MSKYPAGRNVREVLATRFYTKTHHFPMTLYFNSLLGSAPGV